MTSQGLEAETYAIDMIKNKNSTYWSRNFSCYISVFRAALVRSQRTGLEISLVSVLRAILVRPQD